MTGSLKKARLVATREFVASVTNKGFVLGLLMMPALIALMSTVGTRLMNRPAPAVEGQVAIVDPTGQVAAELARTLAPAAIMARRLDGLRRAMASGPSAQQTPFANQATEFALGQVPQFQLVTRAPAADQQADKDWLTSGPASPRRLALLVVHADAVTKADGRPEFGSYDLFVPPNLDDRIEGAIYDGVREALVDLRVRAQALDRQQVDTLMRVRRPASTTVTDGAERRTSVGFNRMLPFVFGGLLIFSVVIGGQTLLTSTVEEKSSRVIEVLLSAVSPLELMAGKIVGQLAVSLLVLVLYLGSGMVALWSFSMLELLSPMLVFYMFVFFLITYLLFGSVFGAVGAAVNEMREAQALMTPVMLILMAPWMLAAPIGREPNSTLAVAMSFIPPVNTFAMMIRLASSTPPPAWQVWTTVAIGLVSALGVMWCAAKVFRVGLLMHGKPPSLGTLLRWVREG